jgi:hypothetical protein
MERTRRVVEQWLRATGTFRVVKRTIQRLETRALQASKLYRKLTQRNSAPITRKAAVVMFHTGRSGSSVIADLLGRHPAIHWDGELFNYQLTLWRQKPRHRKAEAVGLIKRRMPLFDRPFYGFEVLPTHLHAGQMDESEFVAELEELGIGRFILLTRRNILRKIVSNLVARERGQWRLRAGETAPLTPIRVDIENLQMASVKPLVAHMRDTLVDYETLRTLLNCRTSLELVYEDDIHDDPAKAFRKICAFLEVRCETFPVRHAKTTPHPLKQVIQNYDEVRAALSNTEFAWMLEE